MEKKAFLKLLHIVCLLLIMQLIFDNPMSAKDHLQNTPADISTGKWHPEMFYIELPGLSMSFILPGEPERSGVYNLFFISRESGEVLLLDTVKENKRYFTPFSPGNCHDVVLLYNNSTYVRYNDIILENGIEIDMRNQPIQPSDAVSEHWKKTLRAFDYAVIDRTSDGNESNVSEYVTKGYLFSGVNMEDMDKYTSLQIGDKRIGITADGYFEIEHKENREQTLSVSAMVHGSIVKSNIPASSGLVIVLPGFGKARREP